MVFNYYLFKYPYSAAWYILKILHLLKPIVFYCGDPIDYHAFDPVNKYLVNVIYVTDKLSVKIYLENKGISYKSMPIFPETVIMARHSTYKFPCKSIKKIGLRHGAYHFKRMTSAENYNQFDLYLMTSYSDVKAGLDMGIRSADSIGYPKLDPAFNGEIKKEFLQELKVKAGFDNGKPIVLFTATYDSSGMSAISTWCNQLGNITQDWNVLVTLHPWVKMAYREKIKTTPNVLLIKDYNTLPYIMISDVIVGDTSSLLAECSALDKPIITFSLNHSLRSLKEITDLIGSISFKVKNFEELTQKLNYALEHKTELAENRKKANEIFFDKLDGQAGQRAARAINKLLHKGATNEMV